MNQGNLLHVTDLDNPSLLPYRTLRRPEEHIRQGIFVAEGTKVVERLLVSSLEIISILLTPEWYKTLLSIASPEDAIIHQRRETLQAIPNIFLAEKELLETIVGYNLHQGIMAVGKVPQNLSLNSFMKIVSFPPFFVALDGLVNSENVGVVVRNCAAFGVDGIIVGETSSSPYLRRAVRNSMGTVFKMPVIHVTSLQETIHNLRASFGVTTIAAHPHNNSSIYNTPLHGPVCVVFGHEGLGVSREILDACEMQIAIPMENDTDSINVASASAVFLYEVRKQRAIAGGQSV